MIALQLQELGIRLQRLALEQNEAAGRPHFTSLTDVLGWRDADEFRTDLKKILEELEEPYEDDGA